MVAKLSSDDLGTLIDEKQKIHEAEPPALDGGSCCDKMDEEDARPREFYCDFRNKSLLN